MMRSLELKVPPPVVGLLIAAGMWVLSLRTSGIDVPVSVRVSASLVVAVMGIAFAISGVVSFRRARTTVSPLKPEAASHLVTSGIYRFTRNPMYLGMCFVLLAWALFLSSGLTLLGPLAFILYITRFQIVPEERTLSTLFGAAFADYRAKVRRWI